MGAWRKLAPDKVDDAVADGIVLLDFYQAACPPCRALEPRLEAFVRRHRDELSVYQIDIEHNDETPKCFEIMSIPTLIAFAEGEEVTRLDGLIGDEDLEQALATARRSSSPGTGKAMSG